MAICAAVDLVGVVHVEAATPLAECTGFVLLDQVDWVTHGIVQGFFTIPAGEDFAALWQAGFVTPMILGMVAWAVAVLVGMWKGR